MIETLLRFWQARAPQPCKPREDAERVTHRTESAAQPPRPPRSDFALVSIDVGNYA